MCACGVVVWCGVGAVGWDVLVSCVCVRVVLRCCSVVWCGVVCGGVCGVVCGGVCGG